MLGDPAGEAHPAEHFARVASLVNMLEATDAPLWKLAADGDESIRNAIKPLVAVFEAARKVAAARGTDDAVRVAAVRLLGRGPEDRFQRQADVTALSKLLDAQSSEPVQAAAIEALGKIRTREALDVLLASWKRLGPAQRAAAADVMMSDPQWTDLFLFAMEQGEIRPTHLDATRRQRLLQHDDPKIRERAAKLMARLVNPDRQKVIDAFAPAATLKGDPREGAEHFRQRCSTCHKLDGVGNAVGPDLASLTDKTPAYLMVQILDPNRGVEAKFTNYVLQTKSGQTLSGILSAETGAAITLLTPDGKSQTILRADIKVLRSTNTSLMPENLEAGLSPQDLADLLAYLRTAGTATPTTRP
jgi:putative heme-binding domain-containing protein